MVAAAAAATATAIYLLNEGVGGGVVCKQKQTTSGNVNDVCVCFVPLLERSRQLNAFDYTHFGFSFFAFVDFSASR